MPKMLARQASEDAPSVTRAAPGLPASLSAAIDRCLARDPEGRFPDATAAFAALESTLGVAPRLSRPSGDDLDRISGTASDPARAPTLAAPAPAAAPAWLSGSSVPQFIIEFSGRNEVRMSLLSAVVMLLQLSRSSSFA